MDIELNISCPNIGKSMCTDGLNEFLNPKRNWCIIKLSPTCKFILIDNYYNQGFRQFHCSNTIPIKKGGLSGKKIIPYNFNLINYINKKYDDTIIIAGGGIKNIDILNKYSSLNVNHFSASSVFFCPYISMKLYKDYIKKYT